MPKWMNEVSEEDRIGLSKVCDNLRKVSEEQRKLLDHLAQKYCKFKIGEYVYHLVSRTRVGTVSKIYHPEGDINDSFYETGVFNAYPEIDAAIDIDCGEGAMRYFRSKELEMLCTKEVFVERLKAELDAFQANLNQHT